MQYVYFYSMVRGTVGTATSSRLLYSTVRGMEVGAGMVLGWRWDGAGIVVLEPTTEYSIREVRYLRT